MLNELITTTQIDAAEDNMPTELEVLQENAWKNMPGRPDFSISASDLDEFASNVNDGIRAGVPINVEHDNDPRFGKQAAGWIKSARTKLNASGKKALFVTPDWNNLGKELVGDKRFRFLSAEFVPRSLGGQPDAEGKGMLHNVLKKVSLTNNPLMKDLPAISASEDAAGTNISGLTIQITPPIINASEGTITLKLDQIRTKEVSEISAAEKDFLVEHKSELSADELKKFELEASEEKKPEVKATEEMVEVKASELAELRGKASEAEKMETRLSDLEKAANAGVKASEQLAKNEAETLVDKHIKRGAVKSDQKDTWVGQLIKASADDHTALEGMLAGLPDNELVEGKAKGSTETNPGGGASKQLVEKADELIKASEDKDGKPTLTFDKALMQARANNQVLASEADAEASNGEVN